MGSPVELVPADEFEGEESRQELAGSLSELVELKAWRYIKKRLLDVSRAATNTVLSVDVREDPDKFTRAQAALTICGEIITLPDRVQAELLEQAKKANRQKPKEHRRAMPHRRGQ